MEGWNKLSKNEVKKLEQIQGKILCTLLHLPKTTPYMGLLNEVGIWKIEERLKYRKIMLYHNLQNIGESKTVTNTQGRKPVKISTVYSTFQPPLRAMITKCLQKQV